YGLGAAIFHLLTGRVPFEHPSSTQVMVMHVQNPPPDPRSLNPQVSRGAAQLVLKLLAKEPDQRYPDGGAVAEALQNLLDGHQPEQEPRQRTRKVQPTSGGFFGWLKRLFGSK
ncbi:MAG: hypothetical protein HY291_19810, partial [Planctomycetes bacterium]|nr:hypothetical protein [Planctomycetota bacterium]